MKAIILSAGQGRRLLPLTASRPKCLIELGGRSLLEWQLISLAAAGVREAVIVVGYGAFAGEWTPVYLGIVGLLLNYLWFWLDNRAKVTVKGLEAASKMGAAVAVEKAIDAVKRK